MDIRASNNVVHMWTCSDSCYALMSLINYLSSDGDFVGSVDETRQPSRAETPVSVVCVIDCCYVPLLITFVWHSRLVSVELVFETL